MAALLAFIFLGEVQESQSYLCRSTFYFCYCNFKEGWGGKREKKNL